MLAFIPYSACRCKFSGRAWPPESVRRTAPQGVFLCPRFMAGCAWDTFGCAGSLTPGRPTRVQFASLFLVAEMANSQTGKESSSCKPLK
nr:MAG TPA_asm: hypothetical protein [Caudoviricetes sp.]